MGSSLSKSAEEPVDARTMTSNLLQAASPSIVKSKETSATEIQGHLRRKRLWDDQILASRMQKEEYEGTYAAKILLQEDERIAQDMQQEEYEAYAFNDAYGDEQQTEDLVLALQLEEDMANHTLNPATRDCIVCGDTTPIPELPALMRCKHNPQTCSDCYGNWISSELESKGWRNIGCPDTNCKEKLDHCEVRLYASQDVFRRFDTLSTREALNEDNNFRWCLNSKCGSGQIHPGGAEDPMFTCGACGYKFCVVHEGKWHEGETCDEYDYRVSGRKEREQAAQEAAGQAEVNRISKKCPGYNCAYNITKADGCDHMTCSRCRYEFCWECMADYNAIRRQGNSAHKARCKYYSR